MVGVRQQSNFSQLKAHDDQLERLGLLAERYFADDPNTCLLKLRQLAEAMVQSVASRVGLYTFLRTKGRSTYCAACKTMASCRVKSRLLCTARWYEYIAKAMSNLPWPERPEMVELRYSR